MARELFDKKNLQLENKTKRDKARWERNAAIAAMENSPAKRQRTVDDEAAEVDPAEAEAEDQAVEAENEAVEAENEAAEAGEAAAEADRR